MNSKYLSLLLVATFCAVTGCSHKRSLDDFKNPTGCYDRNNEPYTFVVDAHMHFRPYGGEAIPLEELTRYFNRTGVLFANAFGIGQMFAPESPCVYYTDVIPSKGKKGKEIYCNEKSITPTVRNDIATAVEYLKHKPEGVEVTLSMSFADLYNPENITEVIKLYDREFPGAFKWAGELNLVKEAIFSNIDVEQRPDDEGFDKRFEDRINGWGDFMELLRDRKIPLTLHADIGKDIEPISKVVTKEERRAGSTKYLYLMEKVLSKYPDNTIVWAHMGLSKELKTMDVEYHISIMSKLLDRYDNLYFDLSWRVLQDVYFDNSDKRDLYVKFINTYPERILAGTDFVASRRKDYFEYKDELNVTSNIFRKVDEDGEVVSDEAFRNIALGENYFNLMRAGNLDFPYHAPEICHDRGE
jgi:predicted TIM-barrel fold metal-dependent hydrolase